MLRYYSSKVLLTTGTLGVTLRIGRKLLLAYGLEVLKQNSILVLTRSLMRRAVGYELEPAPQPHTRQRATAARHAKYYGCQRGTWIQSAERPNCFSEDDATCQTYASSVRSERALKLPVLLELRLDHLLDLVAARPEGQACAAS